MPSLYMLYEHASGYALFHVKEVEEVGALLPTVERSITDLALFKSAVKLIAFSPFKSGTNALDNVNAVSEGILHDDLRLFLESNVPTGKKGKKEGVELGVSDTRITGTIQEELGIKCAGGDAVNEILRGLRVHFPNMVKGLTPQGEAKAQLGLGHSYSRAKVKFNVNRADNMIIQSIALLDQLDKDINTFSMRVREWYSYHFPELVKIVSDNYAYCRMVKLIGNRKSISNITEEKSEQMEQITMDSAKVKAIIDASKMSMGMDISPIDLINIESFSTRVISLTEYRKGLVTYLHKRMESVAPNLASLIGDMVGARLISHAGSLTNLAKYPASTVQILGAEKALFRALKTKGNTPKYGLIFHSTFIGRAAAKNKGRISRFLANKCSMASRIDCFAEQPCNVFGEKLKEQVEERLRFFETGEAPRKNIDVMKEALTEAIEISKMEDTPTEAETVTNGEKKKKKKKRKCEPKEDKEEIAMIVSDNEETEATPAKKPKLETTLDTTADTSVFDTSTKKKKKKKKKNADISQILSEEPSMIAEDSVNLDTSSKKKKKKKAENDTTQEMETTAEMSVLDTSTKKKKKIKKPKVETEEAAETEKSMEVEEVQVVKKKKKAKVNGSATEEESANVTEEIEEVSKKKKKKAKVNGSATEEESGNAGEKCEEVDKKKKKKGKVNGSSVEEDTGNDGEEKVAKKKKKKAVVSNGSSNENDEANESQNVETKTPKKKKKKKVDGDSSQQEVVVADSEVVTPSKKKKKKKSVAE